MQACSFVIVLVTTFIVSRLHEIFGLKHFMKEIVKYFTKISRCFK